MTIENLDSTLWNVCLLNSFFINKLTIINIRCCISSCIVLIRNNDTWKSKKSHPSEKEIKTGIIWHIVIYCCFHGSVLLICSWSNLICHHCVIPSSDFPEVQNMSSSYTFINIHIYTSTTNILVNKYFKKFIPIFIGKYNVQHPLANRFRLFLLKIHHH